MSVRPWKRTITQKIGQTPMSTCYLALNITRQDWYMETRELTSLGIYIYINITDLSYP